MMSDLLHAKAALRLLKFLAANQSAHSIDFDDGADQNLLLNAASGAKMICSKAVFSSVLAADLLEKDEAKVRLSRIGEKRLKRLLTVDGTGVENAYAAQHRTVERRKVRVNGDIHDVDVNVNESPLARLKSRKMATGEPWISDAAYAAGERLRSDFTRGQLMQKTTSNWSPSAGGAKSSSIGGGQVDVTDAAIDARSRMERALDTVGPELAGLITDVCCFLKGLESVERERRWPPRSAKLMLRVGLDLLARHYGTSTGQSHRSGNSSTIRKWGAEGYRPVIQ